MSVFVNGTNGPNGTNVSSSENSNPYGCFGESIKFIEAGMGMPKEIYTLGTSTREPEGFVDLLKRYGIETCADVRRFPTSRFEHFKRENLEKILRDEGLNYLYLGKGLGGYRRGGYEDYRQSLEFKDALGKLEEVAQKSRTAITCAEKLPWRCHRRHIARALEKKGWKVIHILDDNHVWVPEEL